MPENAKKKVVPPAEEAAGSASKKGAKRPSAEENGKASAKAKAKTQERSGGSRSAKRAKNEGSGSETAAAQPAAEKAKKAEKKPSSLKAHRQRSEKGPKGAEASASSAQSEVKAANEEKPREIPLYGMISPGRKKAETKKSTRSSAESSIFFNFGKISSPSRPEKARPLAAESSAPNEAKPFDRDAVFAEVFGFSKASSSAIKREKKPEYAPKKVGGAEKIRREKPKKEIRSLSRIARDEIFAEVFGYSIEKKTEKKAERTAPSSKEKNGPAKTDRRRSFLFNIFENKGKKKRPDFKRSRKGENGKPPMEGEAPTAKKQIGSLSFDRDAVFAEVFGFAAEKSPGKEPLPKPVQPKAAASAQAGMQTKPESAPKKEKQAPASMDDELARLISESFSGDYPKLNLRKPFTESEKRWARDFESFYASRGQKVSFKVSGATKTGVITEKLLASGSVSDVLSFFSVAKRITARLLELDEEEYKKALLSSNDPFAFFEPKFINIIKTAASFGLIAKYIEQKNENGETIKLKAFFSKYPKVLDYFKGEFLESYGYHIAKKVTQKLSRKHSVRCEVAANLITTDRDGKAIHEYDTVIRAANQIFIIEEKSSPYFCDFNKFAQDMDLLQFNRKNYLILLVNKNAEEAEAVEWLFDFRVANIDTYASKLEQMIEEALSDPIPEV